MIEKLDILAFGAHPDDVELSCAGTILKHVSKGYRVGVIDLTQGELGSRGNVTSRYEEATAAAKVMGIHHRSNLKMKDGWFEINEVNKRKVIEQIRRFKPEIVLANALSDRHPDHGRGGELVAEACYLAGLPKIETEFEGEKQEAWRPKSVYHYVQDYYVDPDFVIDVSPFVEGKITAIKAYKTQFYDPNSNEPKTPISGEDFFDFIKARMINYGRPAGFNFAEGYTVNRFIGVDSLFDIK